MSKFFSDHFKTKKMCKNAVAKMLLVIRYVHDQYRTLEISDKVILENGETLMFVTDQNKTKNICQTAVDNYAHPLELIINCHGTQSLLKLYSLMIKKSLLMKILITSSILMEK